MSDHIQFVTQSVFCYIQWISAIRPSHEGSTGSKKNLAFIHSSVLNHWKQKRGLWMFSSNFNFDVIQKLLNPPWTNIASVFKLSSLFDQVQIRWKIPLHVTDICDSVVQLRLSCQVYFIVKMEQMSKLTCQKCVLTLWTKILDRTFYALHKWMKCIAGPHEEFLLNWHITEWYGMFQQAVVQIFLLQSEW